MRDDVERLSARASRGPAEGRIAWRVVPLSQDDADIVSHLAAVRDLPDLSRRAAHRSMWLRGRLARHRARTPLPMIKARFFAGRKKLEPARTAAAALPELIEESRSRGVRDVLAKLTPPAPAQVPVEHRRRHPRIVAQLRRAPRRAAQQHSSCCTVSSSSGFTRRSESSITRSQRRSATSRRPRPLGSMFAPGTCAGSSRRCRSMHSDR